MFWCNTCNTCVMQNTRCGAGGPHNTPLHPKLHVNYLLQLKLQRAHFQSPHSGRNHPNLTARLTAKVATGYSAVSSRNCIFLQKNILFLLFFFQGKWILSNLFIKRKEGLRNKKILSFIIMTTWTTIWLILYLSFKWWQIALLLNTVFINHF